MIYKPAKLTFDVNSRTSPSVKTDIQFITQDLNTARLDFALTKDGVPLPLSAVVGKLVFVMSNGSKFVRNISLVDKPEGRAEYVLSADEIRHYGNVKAELLMYYTNGQALSIHRFEFKIDRSLIDQDIAPIAEYYIDDFEALKTQIEDLYDDVVATVAELEEKFEDLDNVETKDGAQAKVDAHSNNSDVHVTKAQKTAWDAKETPAGAQAKVTEHANNLTMHVTSEERASWNGRETTTGAQAKVNAHEAKTSIHVTEAEREKWNAAQLAKITTDNGRVIYKGSAEVTDYNTVTQTGMYLIYNVGVNGPPSFNRVFLLVMSNSNTLIQIAYESVTGKQAYFRFRKVDSETWTAWERQLTASDLDVVWNNPTLQPGWKQYAPADGSIHTVRFSKDAAGVVEIKGAVYGGVLGLDTPVFTLPMGYRPMQSEYFVGIASSVGTPGVPQIHRTFIGVDGRVCIQSSSNSANPNEFLSFGFRFRTR
ncbi:BppU family phage baseplate upper protein [Bacillus altitudinis]|uniref:BppU family phage baseplate upper protein n=1 Tax=Bacillus altitudinis TaxID=293387 RepID=UPI003CFDFAB8